MPATATTASRDRVAKRSAPLGATLRRHWPVLALVVLLAVVVGADLWWIDHFRANYPLDIDESRYMAFGMAMKDGLLDGGPSGLWSAWHGQTEFGPLLPLVSVPVFWIFGEGQVQGLDAQLFFLSLLIVSTYAIGRRLTSAPMALLMAAVVAATPTVLDFSRSYQFALTSAAMLTATTYALLATEGFTRTGWSITWGALMGLSSLSRAMMLGLLPSLLIAAVWLAFSRPGEPALRRRNLLIGCALGGLVAITWFSSSLHGVLDYLTNFGYGAQSAQFAHANYSPLSLAYWTQEAMEAAQGDLYLPLTVLLLAALLAGLVLGIQKIRRDSSRGATLLRWARSDLIVLVLVVVEGYVALTSTRNQGVGFRLPLFPALIILALYAVYRLPWRNSRTVFVVLFGLVAAGNFVMKANVSNALSSTKTLKLPGIRTLPWLNGESYVQNYLTQVGISPEGTASRLPAFLEGWSGAYDPVVRTIKATEPRANDAVLALGTFEPLINPNNFILAERERYHDALGKADLPVPPGATVSYIRGLLTSQRANFLLTVNRPLPAFALPAPPERRIIIAARRLGFRVVRSFPLPDGRRATLWFRRSP